MCGEDVGKAGVGWGERSLQEGAALRLPFQYQANIMIPV